MTVKLTPVEKAALAVAIEKGRGSVYPEETSLLRWWRRSWSVD